MDIKGIITSPYVPAVAEGRMLWIRRFSPMLHFCCRWSSTDIYLPYTVLQILTGEQRQLGERHVQLET